MKPQGTSLEAARAAKSKASKVFSQHVQVNGVGLTRVGKGYGVKVNVAEPPNDTGLPDDIDGVPVIIEVVGQISKRGSPIGGLRASG